MYTSFLSLAYSAALFLTVKPRIQYCHNRGKKHYSDILYNIYINNNFFLIFYKPFNEQINKDEINPDISLNVHAHKFYI